MTKFQLAMDGLSKLGMLGKVVAVGGALTVVGAVSASAAMQASTPDHPVSVGARVLAVGQLQRRPGDPARVRERLRRLGRQRDRPDPRPHRRPDAGPRGLT